MSYISNSEPIPQCGERVFYVDPDGCAFIHTIGGDANKSETSDLKVFSSSSSSGPTKSSSPRPPRPMRTPPRTPPRQIMTRYEDVFPPFRAQDNNPIPSSLFDDDSQEGQDENESSFADDGEDADDENASYEDADEEDNYEDDDEAVGYTSEDIDALNSMASAELSPFSPFSPNALDDILRDQELLDQQLRQQLRGATKSAQAPTQRPAQLPAGAQSERLPIPGESIDDVFFAPTAAPAPAPAPKALPTPAPAPVSKLAPGSPEFLRDMDNFGEGGSGFTPPTSPVKKDKRETQQNRLRNIQELYRNHRNLEYRRNRRNMFNDRGSPLSQRAHVQYEVLGQEEDDTNLMDRIPYNAVSDKFSRSHVVMHQPPAFSLDARNLKRFENRTQPEQDPEQEKDDDEQKKDKKDKKDKKGKGKETMEKKDEEDPFI